MAGKSKIETASNIRMVLDDFDATVPRVGLSVFFCAHCGADGRLKMETGKRARCGACGKASWLPEWIRN